MPSKYRRWTPSCLKFFSDTRGSSAVEFGLVSIPFIALFGAIFQTAFMIWAAQNLDENLQRSMRSLYTGTFQSSGAQADAAGMIARLKTKLCGSGANKIPTVFSCQDVKLDVSVARSFGVGTIPNPIDSQTKDWNSIFGSNYTCAKPGDIVVVTAAVKFPMYFTLLNQGPGSFADGSRLLQSTVAFKVEPYSDNAVSAC